MSSFADTKKVGNDAELEVALAFLRAGWFVQWRQAYARRDIAVLTSTGVELIEVKNELAYASSGRICIELLQGKPAQPSGLAKSESTIVVHCFGESCLLYKTQPMRIWLKGQVLPPRPFAGADNFNQGILLSRADLVDLAWVDQRATSDLPNSHLFKD